MHICIYGDVHWSVNSSIIRSRGKEYSTRLENLINSVNWAERLAETHECERVVCLGDFFDKTDLTAEELSALTRIKWAEGKVETHLFLVGNHEAAVKSLFLNSTNALSKVDFHVADCPKRLVLEKADLMFLPFIVEEDRKTLKEYWDMTEPEEVYYPQYDQNRIIFSHNDLKNVHYGAYTSEEGFDLKDIEENSDLFINGHIHNGTFLNDRETILNLGILSGQNFGEDANLFNHFVCILDTDTLKMDFFENPYAFNFYKIEIAKESDMTKLTKLKNNAVVSVKCVDTLLDKVREVIAAIPTIVEHRILSYRDMNTEVGENGEKVNLSMTDHLTQFYNFVLANVDETVVSNDILKEELNKVVM